MDPAAKLSLYAGLPRAETAVPLRSPPGAVPSFLGEFEGFRQVAEDLFERSARIVLSRDIPAMPFSALSLPEAVMGLLDLTGPGLSRGRVLFVDAETTGLSIGTGTIPFLIGLAWLVPADDADRPTTPGEQDREMVLQIHQLFLNSPGAEKDLVASLDRIFEPFSYLCTFNGKSFDIPLIRNRFILQRRRMKGFAHHFDLLHIWKRLLPTDLPGGFRQKNLEKLLLDVPRENDVDGAVIPALYFDWVKYGIDNGIADIIRHNEWDMQGMVGLYAVAAETMQTSGGNDLHRKIRVGRLLYRNGLYDEAISLLEPLASEKMNADFSEISAGTPDHAQKDRRMLLVSLGLACFRKQEYGSAFRWFALLVESDQCAEDLLFLLRLLEHRMHDYSSALDWLGRFPALLPIEGSERRRRRLEKKLARFAAASGHSIGKTARPEPASHRNQP